MFTGYQVLMLAFQFLGTLLAVWAVIARAQNSLKAEMKGSIDGVKTEMRGSIDTITKAHEDACKESREQFASINESFKHIGLQLNTMVEGDVRELKTRIARLESGQDEWTKTLRERTHDHTNDINVMKLKIDRLERPDRYRRDTSDGT